MPLAPDTEAPISKPRIIRDKAFAKRLQTACEANPRCPEVNRGQQKWIYDQLLSEFGVRVSPEAVRKWFAGETRPRPKIMSMIARFLEVDEAWLSLGIKPDATPDERRVRNAKTNGAVNLVVGLIQLYGGHVAYSEDEGGPDMFVIMAGKQYEVDVSLAHETGKGFQFTFDANRRRTLIGVVLGDHMRDFALLRFSADTMDAAAEMRGDYWEIHVEATPNGFFAGRVAIPEIEDVRLIGEVPRVRIRVAAG